MRGVFGSIKRVLVGGVGAAVLVVGGLLACGEQLAGVTDDGVVDAGVETGPDAAGVVEGGPGDAGASGFCAQHAAAAWCEDFDGERTIDEIGPETNAETIDRATLTSINFWSPPRSLRFQMKAGLPPVNSTLLARTFEADAIHFEERLRFGVVTPATGLTLQFIVLKKGAAEAILNRQCESGAEDAGSSAECAWFISTCVASDACRNKPIPPPKALTDWSQVVLEAKFGVLGHVTFVEDGVTVMDEDVPLAADAGANEKISAISAIANFGAPSAYVDVYVDDILVELP